MRRRNTCLRPSWSTSSMVDSPVASLRIVKVFAGDLPALKRANGASRRTAAFVVRVPPKPCGSSQISWATSEATVTNSLPDRSSPVTTPAQPNRLAGHSGPIRSLLKPWCGGLGHHSDSVYRHDTEGSGCAAWIVLEFVFS
jgi:hypothetical protein